MLLLFSYVKLVASIITVSPGMPNSEDSLVTFGDHMRLRRHEFLQILHMLLSLFAHKNLARLVLFRSVLVELCNQKAICDTSKQFDRQLERRRKFAVISYVVQMSFADSGPKAICERSGS